jgi:hypothetical protein
VLLNADVCTHHPAIIEEGNKRHWEWLGHGVTNNIRINQYPPEEERAVIRQIKDTIMTATGKAPRGWLGPGGGAKVLTRWITSPPKALIMCAIGVATMNRWRCESSRAG